MFNKNESEMLARLGLQIKRMREGAGMTPAELAGKLRVSKEVISRIEKGQQDILLDMLVDIAQIFGRRLKFRLVNRRQRYEKKK